MGLYDKEWDAIFRDKEGIHVDARHKEFAGGAKGDGSTDDTLAIRAAEAHRASIPGAILFLGPSAAGYRVTDTIDFDATHTHIRFASEYGSRIIFAPTTPKTLFRFGQGSVATPRTGWIRVDNFSAVGASVQKKIAIEVMDSQHTLIDYPSIYAWTGASSIGLRLCGRDTHTVKKPYIDADLPIVFGENPNLANSGPDHYHLEDTYLIGHDRLQGVITVEDDITISSILIDGQNAWVTDGHGFYMPNGRLHSIQVVIRNVRDEHGVEGNPNTNAHTVYIAPDTAGQKSVENIILDNIYYGGATKNGPYLEGVATVDIANLWRGGSDPGFTIVQPCNFVTARNVVTAPPSIAGMSRVEMVPTWGINSALGPLSGTWVRANDNTTKAGAYRQTFGVKEWSYGGTIAPSSGGLTAILLEPVSLTGSFMCGIVEVTFWSNDGTIHGGGIFSINGTAAVKLSGTANCDLFAAGKLGVWWQSRSSISVASDLAATVNVLINCKFHDAR